MSYKLHKNNDVKISHFFQKTREIRIKQLCYTFSIHIFLLKSIYCNLNKKL